LALAAGTDGLDVVRRIAADLHRHLAPRGAVLLEVSPEQTAATRDLLLKTGLFGTVDVVRDMDRNDRVIRAVH
jgi:methylase of polypeptide subunit release factors